MKNLTHDEMIDRMLVIGMAANLDESCMEEIEDQREAPIELNSILFDTVGVAKPEVSDFRGYKAFVWNDEQEKIYNLCDYSEFDAAAVLAISYRFMGKLFQTINYDRTPKPETFGNIIQFPGPRK